MTAADILNFDHNTNTLFIAVQHVNLHMLGYFVKSAVLKNCLNVLMVLLISVFHTVATRLQKRLLTFTRTTK